MPGLVKEIREQMIVPHYHHYYILLEVQAHATGEKPKGLTLRYSQYQPSKTDKTKYQGIRTNDNSSVNCTCIREGT